MKTRLPFLLLALSYQLQSYGGQPVYEERYIQIGGIEQWISIKGSDRDNPVVLFVHGGPGNPLSPLSDSLYPGWEKEFTLVHYDQRGAGKTYQRNRPTQELTLQFLEQNDLTLEQLITDGSELARYIADYLDKERLILTGTSWGSALAVEIYQSDPEIFCAYIGLSQMAHYQKNIAASYAHVLRRANEENDEAALKTLHELGPPPWTNPRSPGRLRRIVREYEAERITQHAELIWRSGYAASDYRAAYDAGEEFSWVKFIGMQGDGFSNEVDLLSRPLAFHVPVMIIQGKEDLLTTPELSRQFFDQIKAPSKEYKLVEKAGHDPNLAMLKTQLESLRDLVSFMRQTTEE